MRHFDQPCQSLLRVGGGGGREGWVDSVRDPPPPAAAPTPICLHSLLHVRVTLTLTFMKSSLPCHDEDMTKAQIHHRVLSCHESSYVVLRSYSLARHLGPGCMGDISAGSGHAWSSILSTGEQASSKIVLVGSYTLLWPLPPLPPNTPPPP